MAKKDQRISIGRFNSVNHSVTNIPMRCDQGIKFGYDLVICFSHPSFNEYGVFPPFHRIQEHRRLSQILREPVPGNIDDFTAFIRALDRNCEFLQPVKYDRSFSCFFCSRSRRSFRSSFWGNIDLRDIELR